MSSLLLLMHNKNMSISFCLILLLLCISFQACHPKTLHFADNKSKKKLQALTRGRLARVVLISWEKAATDQNMKLSSSKAAEEEQRETFRSKRSNKYKIKRKKQLKRSKVSWPLPHHHPLSKNLKHNNNGGVFHSDYEHARTHPPSHN